MTLFTYGWYVLSQSDHFLDPSAAFVIMALLNVLTPQFESLGMLTSFAIQVIIFYHYKKSQIHYQSLFE